MDTVAQLNTTLAGRYQVEREVGAGGMATVYLARDIRHDRRVALKVLHPDLAAALGAERFLAEIRTTANLQHPHILPLHDSGEAGGHLFYVMPYVEGETLRARLTRETQLPIDDAVRIAREVLGALDYAHRHGIIHRDVKPENILLHDGSALVADFGIALAVTAAAGSRMTQTGLSLGTPQYMSPEQAMGEKSIDGRTDIYGSAAVLYEMLTGEPPFSGASVQAIVAKVLTERPSPPRTVRDTIPAHVEASVLRGLAKLPADRFATAAQFAAALGDAGSAAIAFTAHSTGARSFVATRWRSLALANGLIAAALLALMIYGKTRPSVPPRVERFELPTLGAMQFINVGSSMTYSGSAVSISADGARIAYIARDSTGATFIVIRDLDRLEHRLVRESEGATSVALSPDGAAAAYIDGGELRTIDLRGGNSQSLVQRNANTPHWGADGKIYFASASASGGVGAVMRVPSSGGAVDTLYATAGREFTDPVVLPGGKGVLVRQTRADLLTAVINVEDSTLTGIVDGSLAQYAAPGHIVYRSAGGSLVRAPFDLRALTLSGPGVPVTDANGMTTPPVDQFALSATGTLLYIDRGSPLWDLVWVTRAGIAQRVDSAHSVGSNGSPTISPDGSRVAYRNGAVVFVRNLANRSTVKLTLEDSPANYPAWTPDGRSVSYFARPAGDTTRTVLFSKRADGGGLPSIIAQEEGRNIAESAWSPDGKWVVFRTFSNQRGSGDILGLRHGVDTVAVPLVATAAVEVQPVISPDGRWLAYASDQTGRYEVYVVPFPNTTSGVWSVSTAGGLEPRWSRDGKELFYRDGRDNLVGVAVRLGPSFDAGATRLLFSAAAYGTYTGHQQYDVAADGRFLMTAPKRTAASGRMVLVKNWLR